MAQRVGDAVRAIAAATGKQAAAAALAAAAAHTAGSPVGRARHARTAASWPVCKAMQVGSEGHWPGFSGPLPSSSAGERRCPPHTHISATASITPSNDARLPPVACLPSSGCISGAIGLLLVSTEQDRVGDNVNRQLDSLDEMQALLPQLPLPPPAAATKALGCHALGR